MLEAFYTNQKLKFEIMKQRTDLIRPGYRNILSDIEGFDSLSDFALDMRCSWNHSADEIWHQLEPDLWDSTHNPWVVLQTVSKEKFKEKMSDPVFRKKVDDLRQSKEDDISLLHQCVHTYDLQNSRVVPE